MNKIPSATQPPFGRRYRWVIWLMLAGLVVLAFRQVNERAHLRAALEWIAGSGASGMVVYIAIYIVACVLMLPGSVLSIGAGTVFGLAKGVALTSIGATLGATAAFLVGRYLARDWVAHRLEHHPRFQAIDRAVAREGWKIVGLTRLSPAFPFSLLNYAYGLTSVSLRDYFFASWIGMLPITVFYVYLGTLVQEFAAGQAEPSRVRSPWEWALYGLGLLATLATTIYITRVARRALRERFTEPMRS